MRSRRAAAALTCALAALSCRSAPPLRPLPEADPRPVALLAAWSATAQARHALRGLARVAVDARGARSGGEDLHVRSRQVVVLERPARLRVEIQGFLGATVAVLATDGRRYDLFRVEDRSLLSGPVHDGLLWEVAQIELTPEEAVDLLLGVAQPDGALDVASAWDAGEGRVRVAFADDAGVRRRQVEFDAEGRLRWLQVREAAGFAWEARFDDYAPVGGAPLAHVVTLDIDGGRTRAVLSLRDLELNPQLPPDIFRLRERDLEAAFDAEGG